MRNMNMPRKNTMPQKRMPRAMGRLMMKSVSRRGLLRITSCEGGNDARAMAAKVSMMRFTQSIWVTVSGISVPMIEPPSTSNSAERFTTSWK